MSRIIIERSRIAFLLLVCISVQGCDTGESGVTFEDFRNAVSSRAGIGAIDCSTVVEPNQCIADSFGNVMAAYSVSTSQGIDSLGGTGVAITSSSRVFLMDYDSDPTGGGSLSNGRISTRECVNPQLSESGVGSFSCE